MEDIIFIVWILDILNVIPQLDTIYPINTGAWCVIWLIVLLMSNSKD